MKRVQRVCLVEVRQRIIARRRHGRHAIVISPPGGVVGNSNSPIGERQIVSGVAPGYRPWPVAYGWRVAARGTIASVQRDTQISLPASSVISIAQT